MLRKTLTQTFKYAAQKTYEIELSKIVEDYEHNRLYKYIRYRREKAYVFNSVKHRVLMYDIGGKHSDFALRCKVSWRTLKQKLEQRAPRSAKIAEADGICNIFCVSNWRGLSAHLLVVLRSSLCVFISFTPEDTAQCSVEGKTVTYEVRDLWEPPALCEQSSGKSELILVQCFHETLFLFWKTLGGFWWEAYTVSRREGHPPEYKRTFCARVASRPFNVFQLVDHTQPFPNRQMRALIEQQPAMPSSACEEIYHRPERYLIFTETGIEVVERLRNVDRLFSELLVLHVVGAGKTGASALAAELDQSFCKHQAADAMKLLLEFQESRSYVVSVGIFTRAVTALLSGVASSARPRVKRKADDYLASKIAEAKEGTPDGSKSFTEQFSPAAAEQFRDLIYVYLSVLDARLQNCRSQVEGSVATLPLESASREVLSTILAPIWFAQLLEKTKEGSGSRVSAGEYSFLLARLDQFAFSFSKEVEATLSSTRQSQARTRLSEATELFMPLVRRAQQIIFLFSEISAGGGVAGSQAKMIVSRLSVPFKVFFETDALDPYINALICNWALSDAQDTDQRVKRALVNFPSFFQTQHCTLVTAVQKLNTLAKAPRTEGIRSDSQVSVHASQLSETSTSAILADLETVLPQASVLSLLQLLQPLGQLRCLPGFYSLAIRCMEEKSATEDKEVRILVTDLRRLLVYTLFHIIKAMDKTGEGVPEYRNMLRALRGMHLSPRTRAATRPQLIDLYNSSSRIISFVDTYSVAELTAAFVQLSEIIFVSGDRWMLFQSLQHVVRTQKLSHLHCLGQGALTAVEEALPQVNFTASSARACVDLYMQTLGSQAASRVAQTLAFSESSSELPLEARGALLEESLRAAPAGLNRQQVYDALRQVSLQLAAKAKLERLLAKKTTSKCSGSGQKSELKSDLDRLQSGLLTWAQLEKEYVVKYGLSVLRVQRLMSMERPDATTLTEAMCKSLEELRQDKPSRWPANAKQLLQTVFDSMNFSKANLHLSHLLCCLERQNFLHPRLSESMRELTCFLRSHKEGSVLALISPCASNALPPLSTGDSEHLFWTHQFFIDETQVYSLKELCTAYYGLCLQLTAVQSEKESQWCFRLLFGFLWVTRLWLRGAIKALESPNTSSSGDADELLKAQTEFDRRIQLSLELSERLVAPQCESLHSCIRKMVGGLGSLVSDLNHLHTPTTLSRAPFFAKHAQ